MAQYRNPAIRQLKDQQVRFSPREVRLEQIDRAERLVNELSADATYKYQDLCQQVTLYRPEMYPDLILTGAEAAHDLRLLIEDLSDSADIRAESCTEEVLTVEDLSRQFSVSTKTVDRWRNRGLVSRRFVFGNRKRVGFLRSSVERFVSRQGPGFEKNSGFTHMSDIDRDEIITRARRMAQAGGCPTEISRRLARRLGRATETIRCTLKQYDQEHPDSAVFPDAQLQLTEDVKNEIYRGFRKGIAVPRLAEKYSRTRTSIYRIVSEVRARRLIDQPIDFIYNPEFEQPGADERILHEPAPVVEKASNSKPPPGLPPYLTQLYRIPLLNREQEAYYFRKFNYLKFCAARLRDQLDVSRAKAAVMDQIEACLDEASEIKNLLIRSNLRLVVSIAKKHVKPTGNFFEMVSDGNLSLIRAIEKFDYGRGFKFSTYASWAIMKNYARSIPAENTHQDRYRTGSEELFLSSADQRSEQFEQERVNTQQHQALMRILSRLDERERSIIVSRFGLEQNTEPQTLEQLGGRFGVTKERIRQLETRALTKLRKIAMEEKIDIPGI
ncbi:MAG: sigma-70 family RNA polymerase sigma factor [Planctomycetaceae bacterium]|nr:MAG: sigma-70 family RNA polymerase sigma factor [Planctomycetaceae bacterium]